MTALSGPSGGAFKRALTISGAAHALLLLIIIINPSLPSSRKTGVLAYINLGSWGGGGGGGNGGMRGPGGGSETVMETPLAKSNLHDLTTLQKLQAPSQSSLRFPVEKSKRDRSKPAADKVASVTRPDPKAKADKTGGRGTSASGGSGGGAGLRIGGVGPGSGDGPGGGGGQLGIDNFPYAYYLQNIQDRISARWFQSLVDPGVDGTFQTTVYFRIFRDGSISEVEIKESSGLPSLDLSAKRAVVSAAPFPPLPTDYDEQYLGIRLVFEHTK
ncbi:MAG: energy transducer TonB [Candidatus Aminicenantales bacterium]|jgi:TonB family protein